MSQEILSERLFDALINGDRPAARAVVDEAGQLGMTAEDVVTELFWPTYELVEKLYRDDKLSRLAHHLATRLLRCLCDQQAQQFTAQPPIGRSIFAVCGPTDADELAAQMAIDLLEREGFEVSFAGGGIANDEVLEVVHAKQPDCLLLFASAPTDLPAIRGLIDVLGEIGASRKTQIVVGGGVFNRAEGLAEEIGADLWATDPRDLVDAIVDEPERRMEPEQRTVGKKRVLSRAA